MSRYSFYIDGLNVYHALSDPDPVTKARKYAKYKWLNYRKLAEKVVSAKDTIVDIYCFTAIVDWNIQTKQHSRFRHNLYNKVLRSVGVEIVKGRFLKKRVMCHLCHRYFKTHEEKRTDVNIALKLLTDAIEDRYDKALIISADSDLIPAIEAVHKVTPDKEVGVMFPIGRTSVHLRQEADFRRKMSEALLKDS